MVEHLEVIKWQPHDLMLSTYAWQQWNPSLKNLECFAILFCSNPEIKPTWSVLVPSVCQMMSLHVFGNIRILFFNCNDWSTKYFISVIQFETLTNFYSNKVRNVSKTFGIFTIVSNWIDISIIWKTSIHFPKQVAFISTWNNANGFTCCLNHVHIINWCKPKHNWVVSIFPEK